MLIRKRDRLDRGLRALRKVSFDWLLVWVVVMRQDYVTYLMYNGVFIILGRVRRHFRPMDAWKQSDASSSTASRYSQDSVGLQPRRVGHARDFRDDVRRLRGVRRLADLDIQCFGASAVMVFAYRPLVITLLPAACIVRERYFLQRARTVSRHRSVPRHW